MVSDKDTSLLPLLETCLKLLTSHVVIDLLVLSKRPVIIYSLSHGCFHIGLYINPEA